MDDKDAAAADVPQSEPLAGMVADSAGGYTWPVEDMQRLRRFLCLGSEGGTYYVSEKKLGRENAAAILRLLAVGRGTEVVKEITQFSVDGRTAKQDPIIFALALCARTGDKETKQAAYANLSRICRIPTHLFAFVQFCQSLSIGTGWGRAHRRAIQQWYLEKSPRSLAQLVTKYQQRDGWSHLDLLRLCHAKTSSSCHACILRYIVKGLDKCIEEFTGEDEEQIIEYLQAVETTKKLEDEDRVVDMIQRYGLVREHIPTNLLNSTTVWAALLQDMPMTAMIRNLGKMSSINLFTQNSAHSDLVCQRLNDVELLRKARIHPVNVLVALQTYQKGHGAIGSLRWEVNQDIVKALNSAFYKSFKFVEPTGKRFLLALDVSGSMSCPVFGSPVLQARTASAAMAMVTARTESCSHIMGFSHQLVPLDIHASMSLENVIKVIDNCPMGGTDCALPMIYAKEKELEVDVFIVYTDNETWYGKVHPSVALKQYRNAMHLPSKLIVCGMASNNFTIADPSDGGMLDIAGFDSAAPEVIRNFTLGVF